MTTETRQGRAEVPQTLNVVGPYSPIAIAFIERYVVTEAMVDDAILRSLRSRGEKRSPDAALADQSRRKQARHNIALGVRAGSYHPDLWG